MTRDHPDQQRGPLIPLFPSLFCRQQSRFLCDGAQRNQRNLIKSSVSEERDEDPNHSGLMLTRPSRLKTSASDGKLAPGFFPKGKTEGAVFVLLLPAVQTNWDKMDGTHNPAFPYRTVHTLHPSLLSPSALLPHLSPS